MFVILFIICNVFSLKKYVIIGDQIKIQEIPINPFEAGYSDYTTDGDKNENPEKIAEPTKKKKGYINKRYNEYLPKFKQAYKNFNNKDAAKNEEEKKNKNPFVSEE